MTPREAYDEKWRGYGKPRPPVDPRHQLHFQNRRWPDFDRLCDRARARCVFVLLAVTDRLTVKATGAEQRGLLEVRLMAGDRRLATEPIRDGDLDAAARRLLWVLT